MAVKMICMILGGGAGSRLYPLTEKRSKPAVPLGGKYRLIDIPISNCINSGFNKVFVLTQYNSASLNQHIKNTYNFDIFSSGFVDILAAEQTRNSDSWFQGTADAVKQCMWHLRKLDFDLIMILSGDQLYQMKLEDFAEYHVNSKADLTIATIPVVAKDATGFGIMKVNRAGYIKDFVEKPALKELKNWKSNVDSASAKKNKDYLASMGIYIFNRKSLIKLFDENPKYIDFGKEMIPHAIKSGYKVASYPYDGYWEDIGTIKSYFKANLELTNPVPEFNLYNRENPVYTNPRMLAPSKVFGTKLVKTILADGCIVHANLIEKSIIGIRSRIGKRTIIKKSIIIGNDSYQTLEQLSKKGTKVMGIGNGCHIENAIIDKDVFIGDKVSIIGGSKLKDDETDEYVIKQGIIVIKKGAVINNNIQIGLPKPKRKLSVQLN